MCKPDLVSGLACLVRGLALPNKPAVGCSFTGLGCVLSPLLTVYLLVEVSTMGVLPLIKVLRGLASELVSDLLNRC